MADNPRYQIILLPRQDYWKWVDAVRDFAVGFDVSVTPAPQNALDFHHPYQVVTIVDIPSGYPNYGDIGAWFSQRSPDVALDIIPATTPDALQAILAARIQAGNPTAAMTPSRPRVAASRAFAMVWPTDYPTIVQGFGSNPELYRRWGLPGHDGVDIKAPVNSKIYACADGAVSRVHDGSGNHPYGIHVRIVHPDGYQTIYGHLNESLVNSGQVVKAGDPIGLADGTGNSSGSVLHLTLKKEGATAAGLTRYPFDIIDPTPFLGTPMVQPSVDLTDPTWVYDHCLVGIAARPDGSMEQADWDVVRESRIEALKISTTTPPSVVAQALDTNPAMFVMANLTVDFRGRIVLPADFARRVEGDAQELYDAGVEYFEIHHEPNVVVNGLGTVWRDGYEFGQWFLQVVGYLRPILPGAKFGWPGLSLGPRVEGTRADARLFLEEASSVIGRADWIGCHCFWQDEAGMLGVDGGLGYKMYRDEWPGMLLMITEFSNTSPEVTADDKGRQYVSYYQLLRGQPGVGAAFSSVVSAPSGYSYEAWRSEEGQLSQIVAQVGRRAG